MTWFVNIDAVPAGQALYTVAVIDQPVGTPRAELAYDEVDVQAPSRASVSEVIAAADLSDYEGCRVVGVVNQSAGYVLAEDPEGDLR